MGAAELPASLAGNPRLAQWVGVEPGGTVAIRVGKVELGQGILTALAQIAAEELDVELRRIHVVPARTTGSPDEGYTAGSRSTQDCGLSVRQACAEVRALLVRAAADELGVEPVDAAAVPVRDGTVILGDGSTISYWDLAARGRLGALLDRDAGGLVAPKDPGRHTVVGSNAPRLDLPDKVTGAPRFVHDLTLPGQLFGRVVRPPSRAATLDDVDASAVRELPGVVAVVRDGSFLGVVAEREETAIAGAARLRAAARWRESDSLLDAADLPAQLRSQPADTETVADERDPTAARAVRTISAEYSKPYTAHASIGPGCAVARWDGDAGEHALSVWTHSQGIFRLRDALATVLSLDADSIAVQHVEGAGCYGHNSADDVALDAALLARAVPGKPVQVTWSREDELGWAPLGSAMAIRVAAGLDETGRIVQWRGDVWSYGHIGRPGAGGRPNLLAAAHLAEPFEPGPSADGPPTGSMGSSRNAVPGYGFPNVAVARHRPRGMPLRTSSLRSLGAFCNVFAIESLLDEVAASVGADPLEYRLAHLSDPRSQEVLRAAARRAGWAERPREDGHGYGIAFARYKNISGYCAVVAEVEAESDVAVRRLTVAVDVGQVINPDGLANQVEGGAIQATSWALKEAVGFDRMRVTTTTWEDYPILRFSETPAVDVEILSRPGEPPLGAGEIVHGPTAGAIGNAVADAVGVRVRDLPLTRERIVAAIEARPV